MIDMAFAQVHRILGLGSSPAGVCATGSVGWSGQLVDERADGLADLGVVSQEPVAAALDGHELCSRDAVCRLGREAVRCEGVVFGADDQRRDGQLLEGNRSVARLETKPSKTAPSRLGLRGNSLFRPAVTVCCSCGEGW
jgi:hypothetical protein